MTNIVSNAPYIDRDDLPQIEVEKLLQLLGKELGCSLEGFSVIYDNQDIGAYSTLHRCVIDLGARRIAFW